MPIFSRREEAWVPDDWDLAIIQRTRADPLTEGRIIDGTLVPFGTEVLIKEQEQDEWYENVAEIVMASSVAWGPVAAIAGYGAAVGPTKLVAADVADTGDEPQTLAFAPPPPRSVSMDEESGGWGWSDILGPGGLVQSGLQIYQQYRGGGPMTDSGDPVGDGEGDGGMTDVALPGAVVAGGIWLGSLLARTFGRNMGQRIITGANGVRVRLNQLWPLVRRYGPQTVAGGLGITVGALGTYLANAPTQGSRRKRRGISYADIKRTRRTIKTLRSLTRLAGIGGGGRGRAYRSRPRRGWHSGRHYGSY